MHQYGRTLLLKYQLNILRNILFITLYLLRYSIDLAQFYPPPIRGKRSHNVATAKERFNYIIIYNSLLHCSGTLPDVPSAMGRFY